MKRSAKPDERHRQRHKFVQALNAMDGSWVRFLQDKDILDINYSDLYTGLWAAETPVRKQEALLLMRHLSPQTAKKYLDNAVAKGLIVELPDPSDGRAKLIALSPDLKSRLEDFFDNAIEIFRKALA
ncbi:DNA-binding MarR family transcriptional regulator [Parvibaculum indicum]|uniref:hypothetical protein n=1 Tax=Parvibaculum indicum TaxID=562969 RepID=UPI0014229996|nr:hypothetical protein [Parvibaculum indicum]NIJ40663.1 DNA-binding MarR family transcriptional regulator [Parvibaculum indicum]